MLRLNGYGHLIDTFKYSDAKLIGICFLLTNCIAKVKQLIESFESEGLRKGRTLVIGGYAADVATCEYVRADYCASRTVDIVHLLDSITGFQR